MESVISDSSSWAGLYFRSGVEVMGHPIGCMAAWGVLKWAHDVSMFAFEIVDVCSRVEWVGGGQLSRLRLDTPVALKFIASYNKITWRSLTILHA